MTQDPIAQFAAAKYVNLETFRKSGVAVRTPVWFAQPAGELRFYVYSEADAGKVKRIRNNPKVRIAPCNFRGELRGAWVDARARICDGQEASLGQQLLRHKYGLLKILGDWSGRMMRHHNAMLAIELA